MSEERVIAFHCTEGHLMGTATVRYNQDEHAAAEIVDSLGRTKLGCKAKRHRWNAGWEDWVDGVSA